MQFHISGNLFIFMMRQKYRDKLISAVKNDHLIPTEYYIEFTEWEYRIHKCSRRILAASCFRENANNTYHQTKSIILPVIGYYYALFHMGVAVLYLDYSTDLKKLKRVKHKTLINLIQNKLVSRNLISNKFTNILFDLKVIREDANYDFGVMDNIETIDYYVETGKAFDEAINFIKELDIAIKDYQQVLMDIMVKIGDGFGDDIKDTYLSKKDQECVIEYLISKNLTT
ncbi:hypothetical protein LCGC14_0586040 [marine sediment metagenome]|uniref:HEPN domain-containing protein n=1 Tax=marine sediment metagenome TaxID=412755 RepID=A0A0F9UN88_9ZZZZ